MDSKTEASGLVNNVSNAVDEESSQERRKQDKRCPDQKKETWPEPELAMKRAASDLTEAEAGLGLQI